MINDIGRRRPDTRIVVRSGVPRWFLESSLRVSAELEEADTDSGIAQLDSLALDEDETARRAARFYADFARRVDAEAELLRDRHAAVVVGDIPPLAFAAAARAAVPSLAIGNFTWDWIYEGYPRFEEIAPGVIGLIRAAYGCATRAMRLPLHGGFASLASAVEDIPLIVRQSALGRDAARRALQLSPSETVVLASFGGYGLRLDFRSIARRSPFRLIVTDREADDGGSAGGDDRLLRLVVSDLRSRGIHYEDLVAAADVVVTKPGYGIISECVANGTAVLYTARGRFREHEVLVEQMPRLLRCRYISQEDLRAGRWADAVHALLAQAPPGERVRTDGAAVAADAIIAMAPSDRI